MTSCQPRLIINTSGLLDWAGGRDLVRNFANALQGTEDTRPQALRLLITKTTVSQKLIEDLKYKVGLMGHFAGLIHNRPTLRAAPTSAEQVRLAREISQQLPCDFAPNTRRSLHAYANQATAILPCMKSLGPRFPIPWLGYVYDFQHRHMPELFLAYTRRRRDREFAALLDDAPVVIVNSKATANDIQTFLPGRPAKVIALPFSPIPEPGWLTDSMSHEGAERACPGGYFLISNQFWMHKGHDTAIRALRQFIDQTGAKDVRMLCTGLTTDPRSARHVDFLHSLVRAEGLESNISFLGHIPKSEQIRLLRNAIALIQPTLFEGGPGGGAVYDAVSLGVRSIVSNIPVNLEIDCPSVTFFQVSDPESLAAAMTKAFKTPYQRPNDADIIRLGAATATRLRRSLLDALKQAGAATD
jgi:glycosyltransferase involved in cell wall biosynthesis